MSSIKISNLEPQEGLLVDLQDAEISNLTGGTRRWGSHHGWGNFSWEYSYNSGSGGGSYNNGQYSGGGSGRNYSYSFSGSRRWW
jgi:hypothetical protein